MNILVFRRECRSFIFVYISFKEALLNWLWLYLIFLLYTWIKQISQGSSNTQLIENKPFPFVQDKRRKHCSKCLIFDVFIFMGCPKHRRLDIEAHFTWDICISFKNEVSVVSFSRNEVIYFAGKKSVSHNFSTLKWFFLSMSFHLLPSLLYILTETWVTIIFSKATYIGWIIFTVKI